VAVATTRVTAQKRGLHIVTGGHINEIARSQCSWNVFRVCKSTAIEANAIADTLAFRLNGNPFPESMSGSATAHSDPGRQKRLRVELMRVDCY
jgi:hypothetical protein